MGYYDPVTYSIDLDKDKNILLISVTGAMREANYEFVIHIAKDLEKLSFDISRPPRVILDMDNAEAYGDAIGVMGAKVFFWMKETFFSIDSGLDPEIYAFSNQKETREKWRLRMKDKLPIFESRQALDEYLKQK